MRIAIIGAGISAITIAKNLKKIAKVSVFEKSRGVGGRMPKVQILRNLSSL
jgi:renalase